MKFTLTIDLGNEAMRSGADVANVLGRLARRIELREDGYGDSLTPNGFVAIFDANGNTVGQWEVTDDDPIASGPDDPIASGPMELCTHCAGSGQVPTSGLRSR